MKQPPEIKGKILADLHCHPSRNNSIENLAEMLSYGITGLTARNKVNNLLTYEDAIQLPNTREIDLGLFAEIEYNGKKGYVARAQEIEADFHILALGCCKMLPDFKDARTAVEAIHKEGGVAVLNHPYVISTGRKIIRYRLANDAEERKLMNLACMVDQVEVFNAQNINLFPVIAWMKNSNEKAKGLARGFGFKGTAASDAHRVLSQVKTAGIYLPSENICMDAIKYYVKTGNFERHEQYVSRRSFLKGMFFS